VHAGERWPRAAEPAAAAPALPKPDASKNVRINLKSDRKAVPPSALCPGRAGAAAIACLEALVGSGGALRAEGALYEIGWRRLRELDDPRGALAAWERQRAAFPSGALRPEAEVSIVEALVRLGDGDRARSEAAAFLATHPGSLAAPEVHYLLGAMADADGDCARATPELEAALAAPADPWAADARARRAACRPR
jgi:hypothetical protein